jgi:hypothetical protein
MQLITKKLYTMNETIQQIRDLASITDNVYLLHKITILEIQIQTEIANQKAELINKLCELPF